MDVRDQFVATVKELFETDEQTFNTTYSLGYYNSVRSNTNQGKKPARYSDVQMLWEVFRAAYKLGLASQAQHDTLNDFQEGQWWLKELDALVLNGTDDQKRAVAVVRNLMRSAQCSSLCHKDEPCSVTADGECASQAQQESQWISVEERLPETDCHVLVACEGGNVAATFYAIDHSFFDHAHGHKLSRKVHGKYSKHFELARQYGYKITHWMSIPPAPEGEKE